jgi:transposase
MRDTTLYRHLLGLERPWDVSDVQLDLEKEQVDVWVNHARGLKWKCPECGEEFSLHDHAEERSWRHLDSCHFTTMIHARPPRVKCPKHGVRQVELPWADKKARFSKLFERFAIDVLHETTIQGACKILKISWDEAWHIMYRAVNRGLSRKQPRVIPYYGVDEKSAGKGQDYVTIIMDLDGKTVEEVTKGNKKESLTSYFDQLSEEQISGIEAVSMDMSKAYINATFDKVPNAAEKIVFDRYHIMSHMVDAVDKVRKKENKKLSKAEGNPLKSTRYVWLYSEENLPEKYWGVLKELKASDLKTARAWAIKENLRNLWRYKRKGWAEKFWKKWYFWATHSKLEPVKKAAKTFKDHLYGMLNFIKHNITNGSVEGMNSQIDYLWNGACGFRNKDRFRIAILFHFGGLDLYPATH